MIKTIYENIDFDNSSVMPFTFSNTARRSFISGANWHKEIEIMLVTEGEGYILYDAVELNIKKGDVVVINSNVVHVVVGRPLVAFNFVIVGEEFFQQNGLCFETFYFSPVVNDDKIRMLYEELNIDMKEYRKCKGDKIDLSPMIYAKLRCNLLGLIIDLCTRYNINKNDVAGAGNRKNLRHIKKAMEYICNNFSEPITLDEISEKTGISKYYLAREFKRCTGQTIFHYLNFIRCKHAERLMKLGTSVTDAALDSGFATPPYFTKTYKSVMGRSPSEFKKNMKK